MNKLVIGSIFIFISLFTKSAVAQTVPEGITSWEDCYKYITNPYPESNEDTKKEKLTINNLNLTFSVPSYYELEEEEKLLGSPMGYRDESIIIFPPGTRNARQCIQQAIRTGSEGGSSIPFVDNISISVRDKEEIEGLFNHSSFGDYRHLGYISVDGNIGSVGQYVSVTGCDYGVGKIVRIPIEDKIVDVILSGICNSSKVTAVGIEYDQAFSKVFFGLLGSLRINQTSPRLFKPCCN